MSASSNCAWTESKYNKRIVHFKKTGDYLTIFYKFHIEICNQMGVGFVFQIVTEFFQRLRTLDGEQGIEFMRCNLC